MRTSAGVRPSGDGCEMRSVLPRSRDLAARRFSSAVAACAADSSRAISARLWRHPPVRTWARFAATAPRRGMSRLVARPRPAGAAQPEPMPPRPVVAGARAKLLMPIRRWKSHPGTPGAFMSDSPSRRWVEAVRCICIAAAASTACWEARRRLWAAAAGEKPLGGWWCTASWAMPMTCRRLLLRCSRAPMPERTQGCAMISGTVMRSAGSATSMRDSRSRHADEV
mmetsp:Transcript_3467/g.10087  ORF Transcript_3467/g.10087 Transcript_3467/m.10087 type:complete len:225 (+) Transcript_3467:489-1163(+)